ncbi:MULTISPECIES: hypothetical protein [Heyndrickxia]|uniref:hypothetical protein n=1 Tax=Heyndrickxia TaxID=2837504 RepID=UPI000826D7B8|nr:hypothetical protein [Heyndrickxia sporothermodurans]MBL5769091.1 hypothetical protein [Heyndrickxia sporothermodurans]MBL5772872.1 hypothetical protein [Heyndrickxia sporothermodurans]MBL5776332.1 hypothetical protein [Heyndrickxia sporothermodurans]MBL5780050.1 hypothetical protein [Heyndrickxia sporothermodurans]MBL5783452.1 hypothetical protein [Heyndrickxia sporothermodurans]
MKKYIYSPPKIKNSSKLVDVLDQAIVIQRGQELKSTKGQVSIIRKFPKVIELSQWKAIRHICA